MARSEAQKAADKRYREKTKGDYILFSTAFKKDESERIENALTKIGISKADLIRRAAARIEQGDDLSRAYDKETDSLKTE